MAGHGRTSWDDVAVVTVSILRLVARYEKQNGEPASLSRRELAKVVGVLRQRGKRFWLASNRTRAI